MVTGAGAGQLRSPTAAYVRQSATASGGRRAPGWGTGRNSWRISMPVTIMAHVANTIVPPISSHPVTLAIAKKG